MKDSMGTMGTLGTLGKTGTFGNFLGTFLKLSNRVKITQQG